MTMHELSKQVLDAVTKLDPAIPEHVVNALLAQSEQDVGPCKCRCIHYGDKTVALWRDPPGFSLSHSHPEEQATAILAGKFSLVVGEGPLNNLAQAQSPILSQACLIPWKL